VRTKISRKFFQGELYRGGEIVNSDNFPERDTAKVVVKIIRVQVLNTP